jgi:hypothetical protein
MSEREGNSGVQQMGSVRPDVRGVLLDILDHRINICRPAFRRAVQNHATVFDAMTKNQRGSFTLWPMAASQYR